MELRELPVREKMTLHEKRQGKADHWKVKSVS